MKTTNLIDPLYQTLIGFDNLFNRTTTNYPPYNLYRTDDGGYVLEIAVSGFSRDDLEVSLTNNTLEVTGTKAPTTTPTNYLVHGLATRNWTRTWTLERDIKIGDVSLSNGVLTIALEQATTKASRKVLAIN